ncbi:hypothetical protein ES702_00241 [subsurface metagenome]
MQNHQSSPTIPVIWGLDTNDAIGTNIIPTNCAPKLMMQKCVQQTRHHTRSKPQFTAGLHKALAVNDNSIRDATGIGVKTGIRPQHQYSSLKVPELCMRRYPETTIRPSRKSCAVEYPTRESGMKGMTAEHVFFALNLKTRIVLTTRFNQIHLDSTRSSQHNEPRNDTSANLVRHRSG